ncbi:MAG: hypothetical protein AB8B46_00835 [Candidatus Midichloriaceae bacterium]
MNKHFKNLLISSSLCLILTTSAIACEKHQSNKAEDTTQNAATKKNKKFDYGKVGKTLPDSVKKEVDGYYSALDGEYDKLSDDAKKAVAKISQYKKNAFAKKGKNAKKKNSNS